MRALEQNDLRIQRQISFTIRLVSQKSVEEQRTDFLFARARALKQKDLRIQRQNSFTIRLVSQKSVVQQHTDFFFFTRAHSNKTTYAYKDKTHSQFG